MIHIKILLIERDTQLDCYKNKNAVEERRFPLDMQSHV